ncbi:MAG: hypothetical protein LPK07_09115, partial [Hymenobacteraceae bacterium]|nr:hypothetical protein [Hymenobacteraceae bacterium]
MAKEKRRGDAAVENREWLESLRWGIDNEPEERVQELLSLLHSEAQKHGISFVQSFNTPYMNT